MIYPEYNEIQHYPIEQTIGFTKTTSEWGILSNFYLTPIQWNGITFDCVERLYHWFRLKNPAARKEYMTVKGGMILKMKAKTFKKNGLERHDWNEQAVDVLRFCIQLKYEQCEEFRKALSSTGTKYIVEDQSSRPRKTPDSWGAKYDETTNTFYGKNIMGRILMELRDKGRLSTNIPQEYLEV